MLEGGLNDKPTHLDSFQLTFNYHMDPLHTFVWDIPLNLSRPTRGMSFNIVILLSNPKFDGEGHVPAFTHLNQFNITRKNLNIFQDNEICQLFIPTFKGRIKAWFRTFLAKSIHSWK